SPGLRPGERPVSRRSTAAGRGAQRGVPGGSSPRASTSSPGLRPGERPVSQRSTAAGRGAQRGVPGGSSPRASTSSPGLRPGERPVSQRSTAAGRGAQRGDPGGLPPGPALGLREVVPPGQDGAPVVEVSGRTYPVEVRYRPIVDPDRSDEEPRDQAQAICDAVDELCAAGPGDMLVFLSGEREIRDTADALK